MSRIARILVVAAFVTAVGLGVAAMADSMPIPCPPPDPIAAQDCPQTVLQPQVCGGNCLYVNECHALAAGWKRNHCRTAIGFTRETEPQG